MVIILDRDGVINFDSKAYIKTPEEWRPIPGSIKAIAALSQLCHTVVVATNQSGVGRGYYSEETLHQIHEKMLQLVAAENGNIARIYYCPHHPDDGCDCRKPKPGMLLQIQKDYGVSGNDCCLIGDSLRDLEAGKAADCHLILVRTGNGLKTEGLLTPDLSVQVVEDLTQVVDLIKNL